MRGGSRRVRYGRVVAGIQREGGQRLVGTRGRGRQRQWDDAAEAAPGVRLRHAQAQPARPQQAQVHPVRQRCALAVRIFFFVLGICSDGFLREIDALYRHVAPGYFF